MHFIKYWVRKELVFSKAFANKFLTCFPHYPCILLEHISITRTFFCVTIKIQISTLIDHTIGCSDPIQVLPIVSTLSLQPKGLYRITFAFSCVSSYLFCCGTVPQSFSDFMTLTLWERKAICFVVAPNLDLSNIFLQWD